MHLFRARFAPPVVLCGVVLAMLAAGCGGDAPPPPPSASSEAGALIDALDPAAFRAAFAPDRLAAFTRTTRTAEWDADGEAAVFEQVSRVEDGVERILSADTTGRFSDALFGGVAPDARAGRRNAAEDVLPEDAAFLSPRNRDAYQRTLRADTVLAGRPTRVVVIEAVPGEGDGQAVRSATLYIDEATGRMVALHTRRATETLLFDERGTAYLETRIAPDGRHEPYRAHFDTEIDAPLRPARRFTSRTTFTDVRLADGS